MPEIVVVLDDKETYSSGGYVLVADEDYNVAFFDEEDKPVQRGRLINIEHLVDWALANGYEFSVPRKQVAGTGGFR